MEGAARLPRGRRDAFTSCSYMHSEVTKIMTPYAILWLIGVQFGQVFKVETIILISIIAWIGIKGRWSSTLCSEPVAIFPIVFPTPHKRSKSSRGKMCDHKLVKYQCSHPLYLVKAWYTKYQDTHLPCAPNPIETLVSKPFI